MKCVALILTIFLILFAACNFPVATISKDDSTIVEKTPPVNKVGNVSQDNQGSDKKFDLSQVKLKTTMVWVGDISVEDRKITAGDNVVWSNDSLDKILDKSESGTKIEVDIMNCAGYIGSGNISYCSR